MRSRSNESSRRPAADDGREKPSRAAECIAALYIALVLLTPWLLRDASLFAPARGVEVQIVSRHALGAPPTALTAPLPAADAPAPAE